MAGQGFIGVLVDEDNGIVWTCASDFAAGANPAIEGFDLGMQARVARHPFEGGQTLEEALPSAQGQMSFNGIVADEDALILAHSEQGALYEVQISSKATTKLDLARGLAGPDGLELLPDGRLLVVEGHAEQISAVDRASGLVTVVVEGLDFPTAAAWGGGGLWVVESLLDRLLGMEQATAEAPFEVRRFSL